MNGHLLFVQDEYITVPVRILRDGNVRRSQYELRSIDGRPRHAYSKEVLTVRPGTTKEDKIFGEPALRLVRCAKQKDGTPGARIDGLVPKVVWDEISARYGKQN